MFFKDKKEVETVIISFAFGSYYIARETVWKLYCPSYILIMYIDKACTSKSTVVLCTGMDEVLANHASTFKNFNLHFHFQWYSTFNTS